MRAIVAATLGLSLLGCNHRALQLPDGGDNPPPPVHDLATLPFSAEDMAFVPPDLAGECRLDMPNSTVAIVDQPLPYVWLGLRDPGTGESGCGQIAIVNVLFSDDANDFQNYPRRGTWAWFNLHLPLTQGKQAVTITTNAGGSEHEVGAVFDLTNFSLYHDGPAVSSIAGSLQPAADNVAGTFGADHCIFLDFICV